MKILVTGGAGFIGSNVVDGYLKAGHDVLVVDDLSTGKRENVNRAARFHELDIRSEGVARLIAAERPDVINHHAAQISVPRSVEDPVLDADINIGGLLNLLESAAKNQVAKCIFISSGGAIYGEATEYPTTETYPPSPLSPYAVTKYASEKYLAFYRHQYRLNYTVLRYANIYGPRQIPHGEAGVAAIFMDNLINGKGSTVYCFPEDDAGMIRDYCYVGDVVKANLCALEKGDGEAFNIGTGVETRTLDLYERVFEAFRRVCPEVTGSLAVPARAPARPGDIRRSCLSIEKARRHLGWDRETPLEDGLRETLHWRLNGPG